MGFEMHKPLLMIPGPIDCPEEVLNRMGHQVFPHYDTNTDFCPFYHQLVDKMKYVFGLTGKGYVFIPNGSGTIAVNMMLASLLTSDDEVLVLHNGGFGGYAEKNLKNLGVPYTAVKGDLGSVVNPEKIREEMRRKPRRFIYMTYNESSTAVLNPIEPIGEIAREYDALLLVDAVSAVGGVVIDMDKTGADVVAGASQKCLELPPGLAPVAVGERAWKYMEGMTDRKVPWILDFMSWRNAYHEMHDYHPQPVTGATTMLYALDWVVDQIIAETLEARQERFRAAGETLKKGLAELGFTSCADEECASPLVTEFMPPDGILGEDVRNYYYHTHDTMVGYGFRTNENNERMTYRIAHFGTAAEPERIQHMIDITKQYMNDRG